MQTILPHLASPFGAVPVWHLPSNGRRWLLMGVACPVFCLAAAAANRPIQRAPEAVWEPLIRNEPAPVTFNNLGMALDKAVGGQQGVIAPQPMVLPAPIGVWPFDEGTGPVAHDATTNHNDGNAFGLGWTDGFSGTALAFRGGGQFFDGDAVIVPHSATLDVTNAFAVSAYIKAAGPDNYLAMVDKYSGGGTGSGFTLYLSSGRLRLTLYAGAQGSRDLIGTNDLRDDQWHHVLGSWDGALMRIAVDDQTQNEIAWPYPPGPTTQNLGIGKRLSGWGGSMPFLGSIDEVVLSRLDTAPPVVTCPANQTVECAGPGGTPVSFTATATDVCAGPLAVSCTPASGTLFPLGLTTVTCSATDPSGNRNACSFTVSVTATSPNITTHPQSRTNVVGSTAEFSVVATGTAPLWYQWYWNETNTVPVATNRTLTLSNVATIQAGDYSVVVTNCAGAVTSAVATLTVVPAVTPPALTMGPLSQAVPPGSNATFTVVAVGQGPLQCQWWFNGAALRNETNPVLYLTNVTTNDAGSYDVVVSNAGGSVTSAPPARLRVLLPPTWGALQVVGTNLHLPLSTFIDLSYTIEYTDVLVPATWITLTNFLGTGSVLAIVEAMPGVTNRFYRAVLQQDSDRDGLTDAEEVHVYGTDPFNADSDGDHLRDGDEVNVHTTNPLHPDTDGGTMGDGDEVGFGFNPAQSADDTQDADGDGLTNAQEAALRTHPRLADTDGDRLTDGQEVSLGTDPNHADLDNDGLNDAAEVAAGTDSFQADTDSDGMPDGWEVAHALNPLANDALNDPDGDGLVNRIELALGTDPRNNDSDADGIPDGTETVVVFRTNATDPDGDGKLDYVTNTWIEVDANHDGTLERYAFTNGVAFTNFAGTWLGTTTDGLSLLATNSDVYVDVDEANPADGENALARYVPEPAISPSSAPQLPAAAQGQERWRDTDGDGLIDALDADSDGDGLPDQWEAANGTDPYDAGDAVGDADLDGLSNRQEHDLGTNPQSTDSDGDGITDGVEHEAGTDPLVNDAALDYDGDGLSNLTEFQNFLGLADPDSDDDGVPDGAEAQWNVDTDGDGRINARDPDSDNDGLNDGQEQSLGTSPLLTDTDGDTLSDLDEVQARTDPTQADTDGDGLNDNVDPSPLSEDGDLDGLTDFQEASVNAFWFGATNLAGTNGVLVADPEAKGGQGLVHQLGRNIVFDLAQPLDAGTFRLLVRARTTNVLAPLLNGDFEQPGVGPTPDNWTFLTAGPAPAMTAMYPAIPAFTNATGAGINVGGVMSGAIGEWSQTLNGPFAAGDEYALSVSCFCPPGASGFNAQVGLLWKNGAAVVQANWSRALTSGTWIPAAIVATVPSGPVTGLEVHLKAAATAQPVQGFVIFDEVLLTRLGDRIQLSAWDAAGTNLTAFQGVADTHYLANIYRWVSTPTFTNAASGTVRLVAADLQWTNGNIVAVDRALLVAVTNATPRLTDPLDADTDGDGLLDGAERGIKNASITNAFKREITAHWFQAEDFCPRSQVRNHPGAANGKEVEPQPGSGLLCRITDPTFVADGDYTVYVRARTFDAGDQNNLHIQVNIGGVTTNAYSVTPARFVGFDTVGGTNITVNLYEWFAAVQPAAGLPPGGFVSLPPSISVIAQTGLDLQVHAQGTHSNRIRLDAMLLIKGPYTPTQLGEYDTAEGILCYGLNLINPRISNPMDPDTDLDGYRPKDGLLEGSKGFLTDRFEFDVLGTSGFALDTDLDGVPDALDLNPLTDDSDNDGIKDLIELGSHYPPDAGGAHPGQTATSVTDPDSDEDGVLDGNEDVNLNGRLDPGEASPVALDSDGDGLLDGQELGLATPQAGTNHTDMAWFEADADPATRTSPVDLDSDEDGLLDATEDADLNGRRDGTETDASRFDTDGDGLSDGVEKGLTAPENAGATDAARFRADAHASSRTDPLVADSDHDGLIDGLEDQNANGRVDAGETDPLNPDGDGDGLTDGEEVNIYRSHPLSVHSDLDGVSDGDEVKIYQTNPAAEDTDGDGLWDGGDVTVSGVLHRGERTYQTSSRSNDTDGDGLKDGAEITGWSITVNGTAKTVTSDPTHRDPDGDGLTDYEEYLKGTDPRNADTDGDGLTDFAEVQQHGSPPTNADQDGDGLNDTLEVRLGTNPRRADTDGDGLPDGQEDGNHNGVVDVCETNPTKRDSDGDGITDDKEIMYSSQMYSGYQFAWEAEQASHLGWPVGGVQRYAFTPWQPGNLVADSGKGASGGGAASVGTAPGGVYVVHIGNVIANATYQFYVRLRVQPPPGSGATLGLVGASAGWSTSSEGYFVNVPTDYQWYSTRPRTVTGSDVTLSIWRGSSGANYDVYVDKFILVRLDGAPARLRGGQVTLPGPGSFDTDNDGISDADEIKSGVYWIEAENLDLGNADVYTWNDGAVNGRAVRAQNAANPLVTYNSASSVFALDSGAYNLWVRARAFSSPGSQHLSVRVGATSKQFSFAGTQYYYWCNFGQATATPLDVRITATDAVFVDRLLFASSSFGNLDLAANWGQATDPLTADTDGGGTRDGDERLASGDGKDNPLDPTDDDLDSDGDGLSDAFENLNFGTGDMDGDAKPPYLDSDSDGDGLPDKFEVDTFGLADGDGDGQPAALDTDADGDGLSDQYEMDNFGLVDLDGDGKVPPLDADSDGDGLGDKYEVDHFGTANPDGDTLPNGKPAIPPLDSDADNDGLGDWEEVFAGADGFVSNPLLVHSDADGLPDGDEVNRHHTNPSHADTDGDGLNDNQEIAGWNLVIYSCRTGEVVSRLSVTSDPLVADADGDGWNDAGEYRRANPDVQDTDGDGLRDDVDDNPVGIENEAPTITFFEYSSKLDWGVHKIKVHVHAEDQGTPAKIKSIKVKVSSPFDSDSKTVNNGHFEETLKINWFSGGVVEGFDIEVTVTDLNGNARQATGSIQGLFDYVRGGVKAAWEWRTDRSYELRPFPRYWQGPFGLCAALSCLEIAHYYFILDTLDDVSTKSGDPDVYHGMLDVPEVETYLTAIGVHETTTAAPAYAEVKAQIKNQKDPIYAARDVDGGRHAVVIVGYLDAGPLGQYVIVQDSNITVVTYPLLFSEFLSNDPLFIYVEGRGWLDPP